MIKFLAQLLTLKILINRLRTRVAQRRQSPVPTQRTDGSAIDTPLELEATDWKETGKRTLNGIKTDRITLIAAGMAYYLFLAIFPAIIAGTGILGLAEIDTRPIVEAIRDNLPGSSGGLLVAAVEGSQKAWKSVV